MKKINNIITPDKKLIRSSSVGYFILDCSRRERGGGPPPGSPIFANFIKKWGKLYKKISSICPIFKIQYIFLYIFI